jgi:3-hydroxyacyl-[acyl-carrier-protein] dehydratase
MSDTASAIEAVDIMRIMEMIPHRYPMLLVDRVSDIVPGESAVGLKNVTINDGFFQGHFPGKPVMPGVLIVEALAQAAAVLVVKGLGDDAEGKLVYFMSIDGAKFRKPVVPGDQLKLHVSIERARRNIWSFLGEARVEGTLVAEASFKAMLADG